MAKIVPDTPIARDPTDEYPLVDITIYWKGNDIQVKVVFVSDPSGDPITMTYGKNKIYISRIDGMDTINEQGAAVNLLDGTDIVSTVLTRAMSDLGITGTVVE